MKTDEIIDIDLKTFIVVIQKKTISGVILSVSSYEVSDYEGYRNDYKAFYMNLLSSNILNSIVCKDEKHDDYLFIINKPYNYKIFIDDKHRIHSL